MTDAQWNARHQILACIRNARAALDVMQQQAECGESYIGAVTRDNARDVTVWMGHAINHTARTDAE